MAKLDDRVAIVTGAGSGMGRAIVLELVEHGAKVVALDIKPEEAEKTIGMLPDAGRGRAFGADVASSEQVAAAVAFAVSEFGGVDIVCNNAGILDDYAACVETNDELWQRILGVNLTGPFLMCREAIPRMLAKGKGAIVNTASISAFIAGGGGAAYTASKHGVLGLTRQLAFEYGNKGVRVNAICPGAVQTGMTSYLLTEEGRNPHVDAAIAGTPAGRWGRPEEIARLVSYLVSDDADFIHGAAYAIDGGWMLP
ncbi:MAG: short-chain dehydrogenase/reductase [Jatrophihabitans sp.]|nr:short-chain dehydrogenase/reductase [Jatrophihabitans sp.]